MTMFVHLFGIQIPHIFMNPWFQFVLATPVQFVIGWQFYVGAYKTFVMGHKYGCSCRFRYKRLLYSIYESIKWLINTNYEPHLYFETSVR